VADKDRVAAILGREIAADVLLILTNVDAVYHAYGTPQQKAIRRLNLAQADHLLAGKELGTGSMRPKVEAAADFVRTGGGEGRADPRAIIAELAQGLAALQATPVPPSRGTECEPPRIPGARHLRRHGHPGAPGEVATTNEEARAIAARFGGPVVVKAQVHAGGRGKAGGVKLAANAGEAAAHAAKILGMTIKGLMVRRVLVAPAADIASESYVGVIVDRTRSGPC